MSAEQRAKRVERAQAEVDRLTQREEKLRAQLGGTQMLLTAARAELDWWKRPVDGQPQTVGDEAP